MASARERLTLARVAAALNAAVEPRLAPLILMTDAERLSDPASAARALPRGSAVIVRHMHAGTRAELARSLANIARERGLKLLIANDPALADRVEADGLHLSEARAREAAHWRALRPHWLITAAAHSARAIACVSRADAVLLSPVFATGSHPERAALGPLRARFIALGARIPVYALGGVNAHNSLRLSGACFAGVAAISALMLG